MADDEFKGATEPVETHRDSDARSLPDYVDRPAGWIYKGFRFGGKEVWFASPTVQLLMVSFVCFMCPGMFNALGGLGGGGQLKLDAQRYSNLTLYGVFAVVGFFAGTVANRLGLRMTFAFGGLGYCVYAASFLCYNHTENLGFVVFAGAFLGLCAGLLWTAQGAVMMAYPPEDRKGRYISWFWIIFNCGGVLGSLVGSPFLVSTFLRFLTCGRRSLSARTSTRRSAPSEMAPMLDSSSSCASVSCSASSCATPTR